MKEFNNKSEHEFSDISSEKYRMYTFPKGEITITAPQKLSVSKSGGHRIFDENGTSHYIPAGWIHLHWEAKDGQPNFVQ
jgi:hypothetical protein